MAKLKDPHKVAEALKESNGHRINAAARLGVSRQALLAYLNSVPPRIRIECQYIVIDQPIDLRAVPSATTEEQGS